MRICCVYFSGCPIVLSQPSQVLQIQAPQAVTSNVVAMPTLSQDRPVPVAAPPVVSVTLRSPSSDDDVSPAHSLYHLSLSAFYIAELHISDMNMEECK